jgi:hypothetical protein
LDTCIIDRILRADILMYAATALLEFQLNQYLAMTASRRGFKLDMNRSEPVCPKKRSKNGPVI